MEKLTSEDKVIVAIVFTSMIGGVLSAVCDLPPVIVSLFFAMFIAAAIYRFLGGVEGSEFKTGALRLGGTAAVFIALAWGVDDRLVKQSKIEPSVDTWVALDKETGIPVSVSINGSTKIVAPRGNSMREKRWGVNYDEDGLRLISLESDSFAIGYLQYDLLKTHHLFNTLDEPGTFRITQNISAGTQRISLSPYNIMLHVGRFDDGLVDIRITSKDSEETYHEGSLRNKTAAVFQVDEQHYLIAVIASDQMGSDPWARFGFVELRMDLLPRQVLGGNSVVIAD